MDLRDRGVQLAPVAGRGRWVLRLLILALVVVAASFLNQRADEARQAVDVRAASSPREGSSSSDAGSSVLWVKASQRLEPDRSAAETARPHAPSSGQGRLVPVLQAREGDRLIVTLEAPLPPHLYVLLSLPDGGVSLVGTQHAAQADSAPALSLELRLDFAESGVLQVQVVGAQHPVAQLEALPSLHPSAPVGSTPRPERKTNWAALSRSLASSLPAESWAFTSLARISYAGAR